MSEQLERLSRALADSYTIERELGAGGMATVYLAEDLKHHRKVAVKVLRPELAAVLGADRFVQEITTTANLQHPHILPLFDSGEADGFLYYVMPFIDGETLRDKLNRETQLGIDEAIRITTEVADALDYAHRHNVIHRDIKPENILLHDGRPTVADFGIALAVSAAAGGRMTETGMSLGTPHYMSPEQATAEKDLSNRSDVYSLGAVLYELLTGEPPHMGNSAQQIIMKIVTDEARPVAELRKSVPPNVAAATAKALEKLPADRFASASEFGRALADRSFVGDMATTSISPATASTLWNPLTKGLIGLSGLLLAILAWMVLRPADGVHLTTYDVGLPDSAPMSMISGFTSFSVSPRGDFVVYRAHPDTVLWYRSLVDREARPIAGTEGARSAAISPRGDVVAFWTPSAIKSVPVMGGTPITLAETTGAQSIQWVSDTRLLLADTDFTMLRWVDVETATTELHPVECGLPQYLSETRVLCGGGGFLQARVWDYSSESYQHIKHSATTDGGAGGILRGSGFRLIEDSYLTYTAVDGSLRAIPFDTDRLEVGRPVTMLTGVRRQPYSGAGQYSVSASGTLVYAEGVNGDVGRLVQWNEGGDPTPLPIEPAMFLRYDLAPDEQSIAAVVEQVDGQELRVYDLRTGLPQAWLRARFINGPCWVRGDGRLIVGTTDRVTQTWTILAGVRSAGSPSDTLFSGSGSNGYEMFSCWSPDQIIGANYGSQPHIIRIDISGATPRLDTIVPVGMFGALSPDGRRLAYQPLGLRDVVVSPYPELDVLTQVAQYRYEPQWVNASELVFWEEGGTFYRTASDAVSNMRFATPILWHSDPRFSDTPGHSYKITRNGGLVYVQEPEQEPAAYLRVIPDWVDQMKRAVDEANR